MSGRWYAFELHGTIVIGTVDNEKTTRQQIINRRLQDAGWNVSAPSQVVTEFFVSSPSAADREFSDYVLLGKNGKPIARR